MSDLKPAVVYHPGEILLDELKERGISQSDFAEIINRPMQTVNEIVNGKKSITPETASSIAAALDTSAEMWLGMQADYDLYLVGKKQTNQDKIKKRARLYSIFPIREMIKRNWITSKKDVDALIGQVLHLFSIKDLTEFERALFAEFVGVYHRKSDYGEINKNYLYVWRKLGEVEAGRIVCQNFDKQGLEKFAKNIKYYSKQEKGVEKIIFELKKLGVRLIFLPHFSKTKVDGAVFWLNKKPVILMSLRYDRIDNFYFTLLHEIGHIILHQNKAFYDDTKEICEAKNKQEKEANNFAKNYLVAKTTLIAMKNKLINRGLILEKSKQSNIHPALLIGRLQHNGVLGFNQFREEISKIKYTIPVQMIAK